jgi:hypothetical protein
MALAVLLQLVNQVLFLAKEYRHHYKLQDLIRLQRQRFLHNQVVQQRYFQLQHQEFLTKLRQKDLKLILLWPYRLAHQTSKQLRL